MKNIVSIKLAIDKFLDKVGLQETREYPVFIEWGIDAEFRIGSFFNYKKSIAVIDIEDGKAELPKGTKKVLGIKMGDCGLNPGQSFNNGYYAVDLPASQNQFFVLDSYQNFYQECGWGYTIQDNTLYFEGTTNATKCTVQLIHLILDKDCFPMVTENHLEAIAEYIAYRYATRSQYTKNPVPNFLIQEHANEYDRLVRDCRAEDGKMSPSEQLEIAELINNPLSGYGITSGSGYWGHLYQ